MRGNHKKKDPADLTPKGIRREATNILTKHLKKLGSEVYTIDDEENAVTRFEALAQLVWKRALGYTDKRVLDDGSEVETVFHPDRAYIGMIFDRTEGKVAPVVTSDSKKKVTLASRIGEQARARLNAMAVKSDDAA